MPAPELRPWRPRPSKPRPPRKQNGLDPDGKPPSDVTKPKSK